MNINICIIVGRLTKDPTLAALPSGMQVCNFSIATNRTWTDKKTGERQESADFHNIVVFGAQAESCNQYLKKGSEAAVEGRMQTRNWEKDGVKFSKTEVVADNVQFGSKPKHDVDPKMEALAQAEAREIKAQEQFESDDQAVDSIPF